MLVGFEFCISVSYFHTTKQQQQQPPQQPQQLQPQVQVIHVLESIKYATHSLYMYMEMFN